MGTCVSCDSALTESVTHSLAIPSTLMIFTSVDVFEIHPPMDQQCPPLQTQPKQQLRIQLSPPHWGQPRTQLQTPPRLQHQTQLKIQHQTQLLHLNPIPHQTPPRIQPRPQHQTQLLHLNPIPHQTQLQTPPRIQPRPQHQTQLLHLNPVPHQTQHQIQPRTQPRLQPKPPHLHLHQLEAIPQQVAIARIRMRQSLSFTSSLTLGQMKTIPGLW
jgi:hypothetical protein